MTRPVEAGEGQLVGIPGAPPDLARPPVGCRFAPRCPAVMAKCHTAGPPLLDVDGELVRCLLYEAEGAPLTKQNGAATAASLEGVG